MILLAYFGCSKFKQKSDFALNDTFPKLWELCNNSLKKFQQKPTWTLQSGQSLLTYAVELLWSSQYPGVITANFRTLLINFFIIYCNKSNLLYAFILVRTMMHSKKNKKCPAYISLHVHEITQIMIFLVRA